MASLVGHRVAVWWESHKGKRPQPGGWLGTVHSVALEADKNAYFGDGEWNAGDASHTYIVQYHDG